MKQPRGFWKPAAITLVLAALVLVAPLALAACGGTNPTATRSASATPSVATTSPSARAIPLPAPTVAGTLAFARVDRTLGTGPSDIYVVNTDGSGLSKLTRDGNAQAPSWSPDGSKIAYDSWHTVRVMNADGSGNVELVRNGDAPAWSPDGRRIAFVRPNGALGWERGWAVWVIGADGNGLRRVTHGSGWDFRPRWASDGRIVFYRSDVGKTYTVEPDGSGLAPLGRGFLALSPDESRLAVAKGDRIQVIAVGGGGTPVTLLDPVSHFISDSSPRATLTAPSWAPDGTAVAVAPAFLRGAGAPGSRIYIVNADGSGLSAVPGVTSANDPAWRPE